MKKAFTLVEMLVVVGVLAILMTMVFRLAGFADSSDARNQTVLTMQKLENCLSGYYSAFGSYPPVGLHGDRSYKCQVNDYGQQISDGVEQDPIWDGEWKWTFQVRAACMAQPVACEFPFSGYTEKAVQSRSSSLKAEAELKSDKEIGKATKAILRAGFDDGVSGNIGRHARNKNNSDWRDVKLFKFGLMSFLLPRYMLMMNFDERFFEYAQWTSNNSLPCDPITGAKFANWRAMQQKYRGSGSTDLAHISNIPSQAACARWMANLEGVVTSSRGLTLFGVKVTPSDEANVGGWVEVDDVEYIYSPLGSDSGSTANQYILDQISLKDGWGGEFYYYSPSPFQGYVLWSAGENGKTFPVWVPREGVSANGRKYVMEWTKDDIISLSR